MGNGEQVNSCCQHSPSKGDRGRLSNRHKKWATSPFARQFPVDFWLLMGISEETTKLIYHQDFGPHGEENQVCHTEICALPFPPSPSTIISLG
eukprot:15356470-Ditylum_brightwellii.AAC.1